MPNENARIRVTHEAEQTNTRWAAEARAAGNEPLAQEYERYARGTVQDDLTIVPADR